MDQKYFTLSEATSLIPMIKEEIALIKELKAEYLKLYHELSMLRLSKECNEDSIFKIECQLEFTEMQAKMHLNNIYSKGIQLKDVDHGLVDFPAWNGDEEVFLCWKLGEDFIQFYHSTREGFMGRKKIEPGQFE